MAEEFQQADFPCWCDGEPTCSGRSEVEFGLCRPCARFGHGALPPLPFSLVEPSVTGSSTPSEETP